MNTDLTPSEALRLAVARAGGQSALARMVGCTQSNIYLLLKHNKPLPPKYVVKAEAGTGVSRYALCPEVFALDQDIAAAPTPADSVTGPRP